MHTKRFLYSNLVRQLLKQPISSKYSFAYRMITQIPTHQECDLIFLTVHFEFEDDVEGMECEPSNVD
jgi:hypothetical protein